MTAPLRAALTVKPFRGAVVAAGAVALAAAVVLVELRVERTWGSAALLATAAVPAVIAGTLAALAPQAGGGPRPYHSALYLVTLVLAGVALVRLAQALGAAGAASPGARAWTAAVLAALATWFAVRRRSAVCALVAAVAAGVALLAAVALLAEPGGWDPYRWALMACIAAFVLGAVALRDRHGAHAVALADAAGVAVVALAASFPAAGLLGAGSPRAGWGWELVLLATSFGALAYSAVDGRPGPGWLGALALALALLAAAPSGAPSLFGWPLVLAAGAVALLVVGLRPTTPAPPPPDEDRPGARTVALSDLRRD
ncbi:MAG TPA: hypothetical protein VLB47_08330 [Solirubrobacteraceae bacterium]|nr:hypothetical protein [Solirubrobacteraceae bacterium]